MPHDWHCPHGHRWSGPGEDAPAEVVTATVCPVCGAAGTTSAPVPADTEAPSDHGTLSPQSTRAEPARVLPDLTPGRDAGVIDETLMPPSAPPEPPLAHLALPDLAPGRGADALEDTLNSLPLPHGRPTGGPENRHPRTEPVPATAGPELGDTLHPPGVMTAKRLTRTDTTPGTPPGALGDTLQPPPAPDGGPRGRGTNAAPHGQIPLALDHTLEPSGGMSGSGTLAPATAPAPATGYEILGILGRGGMGVVYKARQRALNRLVALKMILAGRHAGAEELARFQIEAEAVAKLQHPNIVQVYEIGEREGHPFFSLEFIDGGTLHQKLGGAPLPIREVAQLLATLARAMDYAHERGIVHRDLKPANILLARSDRAEAVSLGGPAGSSERYEPKITDFGLAKLFGRWFKLTDKVFDSLRTEKDPDAVLEKLKDLKGKEFDQTAFEEAIAKALDPDERVRFQPLILNRALLGEESGHGATGTGSILGTPSYMAPEQAEGKTKEIGPPADIYALGAILYDLLTGRPPFRGETVLDTLQLVQTVEPVPPRRLVPRLPRDLETITLKCLQKEPKKRYLSAGSLADDLEAFLAGNPIKARPTPAWERALKWVRRRPAAAGLLVVSVAALLSMAVGGVVIAQQESERAEDAIENGKREAKLKVIAETERDRARKEWARAETERDRARKEWARAETERDRADREKKLAESRLPAARQAINNMLDRIGQDLIDRPDLQRVGQGLLLKALKYYEGILGQAKDNKEGGEEARWETAQALQRLGYIQELLGQREIAAKKYAEAITLLETLPATFDRRKLLATTHDNRATVLQALNRTREAETEDNKALAVMEELAADFPDEAAEPTYRWELGHISNNRGIHFQLRNHFAEAEKAYRRALDLFAGLSTGPGKAVYQMEQARTYGNLGVLLTVTGRSQEAETAYRRVKDILTGLQKERANVPELKQRLGQAYLNLGAVLRSNGKSREGAEVYRQARAIFAQLAEDAPNVPDYRHLLAVAHEDLAHLYRSTNRLVWAESQCRKALVILETLAADTSADPVYRQEWARAQNELGIILSLRGDREADAKRAWEYALKLQNDLVARFPRNAEYLRDRARYRRNLGVALARAGLGRARRLAEALKILRQAESDLRQLENKFPSVPPLTYWPDQAAIDKLLAQLLSTNQSKVEEAKPLARLANILTLLANKNYVAAVPAVTELSRRTPSTGQDYRREAAFLAYCAALAQQDVWLLFEGRQQQTVERYGNRAMILLRKAVQKGFRDVRYLQEANVFEPLRSRADFKQLLKTMQQKTGKRR